jgi:hypothetical protein
MADTSFQEENKEQTNTVSENQHFPVFTDTTIYDKRDCCQGASARKKALI